MVHPGLETMLLTSIVASDSFDFTSPNQFSTNQAPVVQRMDNAIQRINRYPVDKC